MATPSATLPRAPGGTREIPHTVSPGLWTLAWRRLRADRVGMVSLAIVLAFVVMMILSGLGLVAKDWAREAGVNYAPPSFVGADAETGAPAAPEAPVPAGDYKSSIVDPLADVMADIRADKGKAAAPAPVEARAATLPFGGDKWGRDVIAKTIKGS